VVVVHGGLLVAQGNENVWGNSLYSSTRSSPYYTNLVCGGKKQKLQRDDKGRLVLRWNYPIQCLYTDMELRKFHRFFGHRSVDAIIKSLQAAGYDDMEPDTRAKRMDISRECASCQLNKAKPRHFSTSSHHLGNRFNHVIEVDLVSLSDGADVHIAYTWTRFNAGRFKFARTNPTAGDIWRVIRQCWLEAFVGPPDVIRVDQGTKHFHYFMNTACVFNGIDLRRVPTEAAWCIGNLKRNHAPLRDAYEKIKSELPDLGREDWISMAIKTMNDTVDDSGFSPTFVVFGTTPRPFPALSREVAPIHADRLHAMQLARRMIETTRQRKS
jgi:hypothetical protein